MNSLRNKVQLIGNVGGTPTVKTLESGAKVASFSIATDDSYKDKEGNKVEQVQWHNVEAWGKVVDIVEKYVDKGSQIGLEGKLVTETYEDKDGVKRYNTKVRLNELLLLGKAN